MGTTVYFRNGLGYPDRMVGSFFARPVGFKGPDGTRRDFQCDVEDRDLFIRFCRIAHSIPIFIDDAGNSYTGNDLLPYLEEK